MVSNIFFFLYETEWFFLLTIIFITEKYSYHRVNFNSIIVEQKIYNKHIKFTNFTLYTLYSLSRFICTTKYLSSIALD